MQTYHGIGDSNEMELNELVFIHLFKAACEKCFGYPLSAPLSETDSRLLSNKILESTGLVIGVKSIKNYSAHVLRRADGKKENPSIATLDTFARYVVGAAPIDEIQRKQNEDHHPYWFEYKSTFAKALPSKGQFKFKVAHRVVIALLLAVGAVFLLLTTAKQKSASAMVEHFNSVNDSLRINGWAIRNLDTAFWNRRGEKAGHLTLFTLVGDNWPGPKGKARIRNLLVRPVDAECFITEVHLSDFFPNQNWQQAGILLAEDSTFTQKVVRLSISYNDFFGGFAKSPEIIIQIVASPENGNLGKPEEIGHVPLYTIEKGKENLVRSNLSHSSLRIEKKGKAFRFLYTTSPGQSFAFNEVAQRDLTIKPNYVGLFAIQGLADTETPVPAYIDSFSFTSISCEE